jgi:hypothetical protein
MKLIVAGSRDGIPKDAVFAMLNMEVDVDEDLIIVSGAARGVDKYGEEWAYLNNVDVVQFPADWKKYGKRAGYVRNTEMANYADELFAFWDSKSPGTGHMIKVMTDLKKPVTIFRIPDEYLEREEQ